MQLKEHIAQLTEHIVQLAQPISQLAQPMTQLTKYTTRLQTIRRIHVYNRNMQYRKKNQKSTELQAALVASTPTTCSSQSRDFSYLWIRCLMRENLSEKTYHPYASAIQHAPQTIRNDGTNTSAIPQPWAALQLSAQPQGDLRKTVLQNTMNNFDTHIWG